MAVPLSTGDLPNMETSRNLLDSNVFRKTFQPYAQKTLLVRHENSWAPVFIQKIFIKLMSDSKDSSCLEHGSWKATSPDINHFTLNLSCALKNHFRLFRMTSATEKKCVSGCYRLRWDNAWNAVFSAQIFGVGNWINRTWRIVFNFPLVLTVTCKQMKIIRICDQYMRSVGRFNVIHSGIAKWSTFFVDMNEDAAKDKSKKWNCRPIRSATVIARHIRGENEIYSGKWLQQNWWKFCQ